MESPVRACEKLAPNLVALMVGEVRLAYFSLKMFLCLFPEFGHIEFNNF